MPSFSLDSLIEAEKRRIIELYDKTGGDVYLVSAHTNIRDTVIRRVIAERDKINLRDNTEYFSWSDYPDNCLIPVSEPNHHPSKKRVWESITAKNSQK